MRCQLLQIAFSRPAELTNTPESVSVEQISCPAKSVHRMLSSSGNPTMTNLAAIFSALKSTMKVDIQAHCVSVA
jgi:DNA-binding phage protein